MIKSTYSMSFTTGSLLIYESIKIAEVYYKYKDWKKVREEVIKENLLQLRTQNSIKRVCAEIISRLKRLNNYEIEYLVSANSKEQGYILWIALCRRYKYIAEFALEVLNIAANSISRKIDYDDYNEFFEQKKNWDGRLENLAKRTTLQIRSLIFKMMQQADLISQDGNIKTVIITPSFRKIIDQLEQEEKCYLPISEL
jgi:hypothetical protein